MPDLALEASGVWLWDGDTARFTSNGVREFSHFRRPKLSVVSSSGAPEPKPEPPADAPDPDSGFQGPNVLVVSARGSAPPEPKPCMPANAPDPDPERVARLLLLFELTPKQVGYVMQVPSKSIVGLCANGRIPGAAKVGKMWRINKARFVAWRSGAQADDDERSGSRDLATGQEAEDRLLGAGEGSEALRREKADRHVSDPDRRSKSLGKLRKLLR